MPVNASGAAGGRPLALVTGASRGIGAAAAEGLAIAGWDVVVHYRRSRASAEAVAARVRQAGGRASCQQADVSSAADVASLAERVRAEVGVVTGLVVNAGINHAGRTVEQTLEEWSEIVAVNLTAPFLCMQAFVPGMLEVGGGSIVAVSSIAGLTGGTVGPGYAASKGGLNALTQFTARDLTRTGVRVNAVAPIYTATEMAANVPAGEVERVVGNYRLGRMVRPEEVANVITYLLGPDASAVTGEVVTIGA